MKRKEPPPEGPQMSALCRTVQKDGWELEICIFEDGEGKWLLEIVNDANTSTCWTDPFDTEQQALDEALKTIKENDIAYFEESQPWRQH
jgi:hypothetical protein